MSSEPFKALKVSSSHLNGLTNQAESVKTVSDAPKSPPRLEDISSPHELTAFVESLLGQLEGKFEDMSSQILDKLNQMSVRVDSLETSIQDLINGGPISLPTSPAPSQTRRCVLFSGVDSVRRGNGNNQRFSILSF